MEIESSRKLLLQSIEGASDVTFIRTYGNIGDELIWAGTRQLLAGIDYCEASILHLDGVTGDLAVVSGSGGWCAPYHDLPKFLPRIEDQFRQVVILPSSFDTNVPEVRVALERTKALVFARERVSWHQIRPLCHAELAHDCAFFFDFRPYKREGEGVLVAYRTDRESTNLTLPDDNVDISVTCESLDEWLWAIARHGEVRTDRAHVMIAAALLGKHVQYRPSSYHKLPAIAEFALCDYSVSGNIPPVRAIKDQLINLAEQHERLLPEDFLARHDNLEVTVVMLSHMRLDQTLNALAAILNRVKVPFRILVIENGSGPVIQGKLKEIATADDRIELLLLDENLGCAGGRSLAIGKVTTPFVFLIDNDIEVLPGCVEHLLHQFDLHPDAIGVTGTIVFPDGSIHVCGTDLSVRDGVLNLELLGNGQPFTTAEMKSGSCQSVPSGMTMIRTETFSRFPFDSAMNQYYEDTEWSYRIEKSGAGRFYRSAEAVGIHYHIPKIPDASLDRSERLHRTMKLVEPLSRFYQQHNVIYSALFHVVPELGGGTVTRSRESAGRLLDLVNRYGGDAVLDLWKSGDLETLFATEVDIEKVHSVIAEPEVSISVAEHQRLVELIARYQQSATEVHSSRVWKIVSSVWKLTGGLRQLRDRMVK